MLLSPLQDSPLQPVKDDRKPSEALEETPYRKLQKQTSKHNCVCVCVCVRCIPPPHQDLTMKLSLIQSVGLIAKAISTVVRNQGYMFVRKQELMGVMMVSVYVTCYVMYLLCRC